MTSQPAPRRTVHHGHVSASGYWWPASVTPRVEALRRILPLFEAGLQAFETDWGVIVELASPTWIDTQQAPGTPLMRVDEALISAPLTRAEREALGSGARVVLVDAGQVRRLSAEALRAIDLGEAIDVSAFDLQVGMPLGPPPAPPEPAISNPRTAGELFDAPLGRLETAHARQEVIEALGRRRGRGGGGAAPSLLAALRRALARLRPSRPPPGARGSALPERIEIPRISPLQRLLRQIDGWLSNLLYRSWFGRLLSRQHARYLQELFELLDAQRDLDALKRAIPLSSTIGHTARMPWLPLAPRSSLDIQLARPQSSSMLGLGSLFDVLKARYEAAFRRLEAAGRHSEAAFVLAELLDDAPRAVAYLERRGERVLAAELAEARKLEPALVVRQWFLAGNHRRAVRLAVQHSCFFDAIHRLERSKNEDEASALRLLYADRLADAGKLVQAARILRHPGRHAQLRLRFLQLARQQGDLTGIDLELEAAPARFQAIWQDVSALIERSDRDSILQRVAIAKQLTRSPRSHIEPSAIEPIARELGRQLIADAASGDGELVAVAGKVARWIGGAFRADFPSLVSFERRAGATLQHGYAGHDAGVRPVFDVFPLHQRFVLALGELGVRVVNRDGNTVAEFDTPAERLVLAPGLPFLLALARRGDAWLVSRIHLGTRRSEVWTEVRATAVADTFDGESWVVTDQSPGSDGHLLVLDAASPLPTTVKRISLPDDFFVQSISVRGQDCTVLGGLPYGELERLRYELPAYVLRERMTLRLVEPADAEGPSIFCGAYASDVTGAFAKWHVTLDPETGALSHPRLLHGTREIPLPPGDLSGTAQLHLDQQAFALSLTRERGSERDDGIESRVLAGTLTSGVVLDLDLAGAASVALRLTGASLVLGDAAGRVLAYDLDRPVRVADLRTR